MVWTSASSNCQQRLIVLPSYGITAHKQTEKSKQNKPDITVKDKRENHCKLINVKIPADRSVSVAEFVELSKYKDLENKVEKPWQMKTVIGTLNMILKVAEEHLEQIPGSPNLAEMQKIALKGTAHILIRTLSM